MEVQHCNCCGKELDFWDNQEDFTIHRQVGYGSFYDGENILLRICCSCFDDIIAKCKVSPILSLSDTDKKH